ncbi:DUF4328 domain-containing protein [Nannocystaceae bacterium ST9]
MCRINHSWCGGHVPVMNWVMPCLSVVRLWRENAAFARPTNWVRRATCLSFVGWWGLWVVHQAAQLLARSGREDPLERLEFMMLFGAIRDSALILAAPLACVLMLAITRVHNRAIASATVGRVVGANGHAA